MKDKHMISESNMNEKIDYDLPFFAYGLFKPGEVAHKQVEQYLDSDRRPLRVSICGSLYIRDGLPLLQKLDQIKSQRIVKGYLLYFNNKQAYDYIDEFEPEEHYTWGIIETCDSGKKANALIGRRLDRGGILLEDNDEWFGNLDPVFNEGLDVVRRIIDGYAQKEFDSTPPENFDWDRLFYLQMAYLLLWTVIERYCTLSFGPRLEPNDKINKLGEDAAFKRVLKTVVKQVDSKIYDSRDPKKAFILDPANGSKSAQYYYRVRSNISHRGKGAWKDGNIVLNALTQLEKIVTLVLEEQGLRRSSSN